MIYIMGYRARVTVTNHKPDAINLPKLYKVFTDYRIFEIRHELWLTTNNPKHGKLTAKGKLWNHSSIIPRKAKVTKPVILF